MKISYRQINIVLSSFIILWLNAGNFDYVSDYFSGIMKLGVVLIWFFFAIKMKSGFIGRYICMSWPIFTMMLLLFLSHAIGRIVFYDSYFTVYIYIAIIQALFVFYFYYGDKRDIKILLVVFFADIVVESVHTFIEVLNNPIIVRAMSTGAEMKSKLLNNLIPDGVGGYALCYQITFLAFCMGFLFNEKIKNSFLKYLIYVGAIALLFQAQITIALMMAAAFIVIAEIIRTNETPFMIIFKLIIFVAIMVLMMNIDTVMQFVIGFANEDLANRLNELLMISSSNSNDASDFNTRIELYETSISSFVNNPLWGTFGERPFGGHSTFLDLLAGFGLMGFFGIYGIIKPLLVLYKNCIVGSAERRYTRIIIIGYVLLSMINVSIGSDLSLVFCLIIPLFFVMFAKNQAEYHKNI